MSEEDDLIAQFRKTSTGSPVPNPAKPIEALPKTVTQKTEQPLFHKTMLQIQEIWKLANTGVIELTSEEYTTVNQLRLRGTGTSADIGWVDNLHYRYGVYDLLWRRKK